MASNLGFESGIMLGGLVNQGLANRADKKQQEIMGGLRRSSLGLGGETPEQQEQANLELLSANPEQAGKFFSQFKQMPKPEQERIKESNRKISLAAANVGQLPDEQLAQGLAQTAKALLDSGDPAAAERAMLLSKEAQADPAAARMQLKAIEAQGRDIEKVLSGSDPAVRKEFLKEERQQARSSVNNLTKRAVEVNTAYDRINSLLNQGTRAANASIFQLVARLASPGIVTEKEAGALAGGANGIAALATLFDEKGAEDIGELLRKAADPNNPDLFDVEGMRNLTEALVSSEVPFLLEEFEGAKNRAMTANIAKDAFDTNFGEQNTKSITGLKRFIKEGDMLTPEEKAEADALKAELSGQQ